MAALYEGVDVWIADCLTRTPHPTHAHLDGVLGWARDLRVGQLYLTHMGNGLDYRTLVAELPDWAAPAYDGLEIELDDQRPDARRRLYPDGDDARAGRADGAARAGGEAGHDGAGLGRDLRRRLRPVHLPRQFRLGRAAAEGRSGRNAGQQGQRNPHPDGDRRPFLGRCASSTARRSSSWSTAARP